MSLSLEFEKDLAVRAIASGVETPEEVADRLGVNLGLVRNWCSTPQFRSLCRYYDQDVLIFDHKEEAQPNLRVEDRAQRREEKGQKDCREHSISKQRLNSMPKPKLKPESEPKPEPEHSLKSNAPRAIHHDRAKAIADVSDGMSKCAAARKYNVSRRTMDRWSKSANVESRFGRGQRFSDDLQDLKDRGADLVLKNGYSCDAAGEAVGLSGETIRTECRSRGIASRFSHKSSKAKGKVGVDPKRKLCVRMIDEEKLTYAHVARTEGIPESTLRGWCREDGVQSPLAWNRSRKKS